MKVFFLNLTWNVECVCLGFRCATNFKWFQTTAIKCKTYQQTSFLLLQPLRRGWATPTTTSAAASTASLASTRASRRRWTAGTSTTTPTKETSIEGTPNTTPKTILIRLQRSRHRTEVLRLLFLRTALMKGKFLADLFNWS